MPPETSRVTEELWAYLRPGVDYVMTVSMELPNATYIGIYTTLSNVWQLCTPRMANEVRALATGRAARYSRGAQYLNCLFAYLNRDWVTREQSEGNTTVYPVHQLALLHWKKDMVLRIQNGRAEKLSSIVMRVISDDDRGFKGRDRIKVLRGVTDSFLALDLAEDEPFRLCMTDYTRRFKPPSL
ncbi:Cullin repeat-like-containing domain protein [Ephemerocybe angulata]|uniref:Cullin repeat-like-containing domain protein n=1 Tax=Ephemerocybe angulata TaxID=980116 RepID=A0A8H6HQT1_9AGAR|nr:Cullin repeat-like-containing domain protein [Tulosesus angulatus]